MNLKTKMAGSLLLGMTLGCDHGSVGAYETEDGTSEATASSGAVSESTTLTTGVANTGETTNTTSASGANTDTTTEPTSGSETTTTSTGDTGDTEVLPGACTAAPETDAVLAYDVEAWPSNKNASWFFDAEVSCTVSNMNLGDPVVTTLDCVEEGTTFPVTLAAPPVPEGAPAWTTGEEVTLRLKQDTKKNNIWALSLRRLDGDLLLMGLTSPTLTAGEFFNATGFLDPIEPVTSQPCGGDETSTVEVEFSLMGESISLFGGQRGALPVGDGELFAIDLTTAEIAICCSAIYWYDAVIQRVAP